MEGKEKEFLTKSPEPIRSPSVYLLEEMQTDLSVFAEDARPLVEKFLRNEGLSRVEQKKFDLAREKWWMEKYGFPFSLKVERNELLLRKHGSSVAQSEAQKTQENLFASVGGGNEKKIAELKKEYEEKYPDQLEGVETLFGLRDFLAKQTKLDELRKKEGYDYASQREIFRDLTEYRFLLTHFIIQNGDNKEFLELFWEICGKIAEKEEALRRSHQLQRSTASQVAVYRILESLGKKPKLSHPDEDAFDAIDLWSGADEAVQVTMWDERQPAILESDHVAFPGAETVADDGGTKHYNPHVLLKNAGFVAKVREYGERMGKNIKGYMLIVPRHKIDFVTGEPAPELVEFFRKKLEKA